eukprot:2801-Prymnesium_polylepis.1
MDGSTCDRPRAGSALQDAALELGSKQGAWIGERVGGAARPPVAMASYLAGEHRGVAEGLVAQQAHIEHHRPAVELWCHARAKWARRRRQRADDAREGGAISRAARRERFRERRRSATRALWPAPAGQVRPSTCWRRRAAAATR